MPSTEGGDFASLSGARCVVTGGLGFIGSNLGMALAGFGAQVTAIDDLKEGHGGNKANVDPDVISVVLADVGDAVSVEPAVFDADYVFDLAGQVSHVAALRDPVKDLSLNTIARVRFLDILHRVNPSARLVYTSTRQVYGRGAPTPTSEQSLPRPSDVNGVAKLAAEQLHRVYAPGRNVILRLSNVYGPRQHLRSDELGVLPVFVRQALRGEPVPIFGDGQTLRDPLHVDDVVDAIIRAALTSAAADLVINIGHEEVLTVRRLAELTAAAAANRGASVRQTQWAEDYQQVAIGSAHVSSALAFEVFGWCPRIRFADGITETLKWFSRHPERFS